MKKLFLFILLISSRSIYSMRLNLSRIQPRAHNSNSLTRSNFKETIRKYLASDLSKSENARTKMQDEPIRDISWIACDSTKEYLKKNADKFIYKVADNKKLDLVTQTLKIIRGNNGKEEQYVELINDILNRSIIDVARYPIWHYNPWHDSANYDENIFEGKHPIHISVMYSFAKILTILLQHTRDDINLRDTEGRISLHYAKSEEIGKMLIDRGANVNIQDKDGNTPLHLAPVSLISLLIKNNADTFIKNNEWNEIGRLEDYDGGNFDANEKDAIDWYVKTDPENIMEHYEIENKLPIHKWLYIGLTPVMKSVVYGSNVYRFEKFLECAPKETILKQINSLLVLTKRKSNPEYNNALMDFQKNN